jgi:DNA helicase-4
VLDTQSRSDSPQVYLHWEETISGGREFESAAIERIVRTIVENIREDHPSLLILSRYNHHLPSRTALSSIEKLWPGEIKSPLTIHRSKGLEADYVIVHGFAADKYGFPSEIEDDPLLSLVLARPENFPHAEERRLFYVALTRARHQVHLLVDRRRPSVFALELKNPEYNVQHFDPTADMKREDVVHRG